METEIDTAVLLVAPVAAKLEKPVKAADAKWGSTVMQQGYCMIPSLLLKAQNRLKLTSTQMAVLLQICDYWWEAARKPYPGKEALAMRMGMTGRQVQRHIAALEEKKLVARIPRFDASNGGRSTNMYDLSGLVSQLQALEPEFRKVEDDTKRNRRAVQKRTYRRATPVQKVST